MSRRSAYNYFAKTFSEVPPGQGFMHGALLNKAGIGGASILTLLIQWQVSNPSIEKLGGWFDLASSIDKGNIKETDFRQRIAELETIGFLKKSQSGLTQIDMDLVHTTIRDYNQSHEGRRESGWVDFLVAVFGGGELLESHGAENGVECAMESVKELAEKGFVKLEQEPDGSVWMKPTLGNMRGLKGDYEPSSN